MRVLREPDRLQRICWRWRAEKKRIALVPTMGALHDGHLSLLQRARRECERVVMSLFVNPLQFDRKRDFRAYPRDFSRDVRLARALGVDILFAPSSDLFFPSGFETCVRVENLSRPLDGRFRPGHFEGVATVVGKLLILSAPHRAYFGEKDFQQAVIIGRLIRDLHVPVLSVVCPTIRASDGLALSSRNGRLSLSQRIRARSIYQALCVGKELILKGEKNPKRILEAMRRVLNVDRVDYVEVSDPKRLTSLKTLRRPVLLSAAAWFGKTRLIDNLLVK